MRLRRTEDGTNSEYTTLRSPCRAIAWSYEHPKEGAEQIEGHLAFFSDWAEILVDGVAL